MLYSLIFIAIISIVFIAGKANLSIRFNKQVNELFTQSKSISGKIFSYQQLAGLPEPVQKYFKLVLKEGQPYINYVRLKHDGKFKPGLDKEWVAIKGEQYFTTEKPGFIWKGKTSMFTARDSYIAEEGRLVVNILSLFKVADGKGANYNQGELLRWLAESVWFPTNLLPSENVQWLPIDNLSAKLTFNYNDLSLFFIVRFNNTGGIAEMETKRYLDEKKISTWICKMEKYNEINGIFIPTEAEAFWRLEKGDFSYAKFNVKVVEYDKPQRF